VWASNTNMNNKTEAQVLAGAYEAARSLSDFYISKFENLDINKQLESDGVKFNSAHWILAHLVWTEHFLLVQGIGNKSMDIPWLEEYMIGTNPDDAKTKMTFSELMGHRKKVHEEAIKILNELSDEEIEKPNYIDAKFGGVNNKRNLITHTIRHEPMHIGQLSWILKFNGVAMP
jgi:uncharacterized damage-inducible protein DinB